MSNRVETWRGVHTQYLAEDMRVHARQPYHRLCSRYTWAIVIGIAIIIVAAAAISFVRSVSDLFIIIIISDEILASSLPPCPLPLSLI